MKYEAARLSISKTAQPLANEVRIEIKREIEIPEYGTIPVQFVGIIDRIFEAPDGGSMLFELKTGKWKDNKTTNMRKEMAYYKFLIDNCDSAVFEEKVTLTEKLLIGVGDIQPQTIGQLKRSKERKRKTMMKSK